MKLRVALLCCVGVLGCGRNLSLPEPPPTTAFLTGRVVAAVPGTAVSAPVANVSVSLLNTNISGTTGPDGVFVLGPLPSGTFRVFFSSRGATSRQRIVNDVRIRPAFTNNLGDVSLQENALLTGRALIQGRTSGNVGITVFSPGTDYVTTSADNGGWLLANLPEGAIRATAWRPGFTPATTTDIDLQGGVVTSAVDLILEPEAASAPPGSIVGSVVVLGHDDNSGVTVKAISAQTRELRATATSDTEGKFTLPGLSSDLYVVTLELAGYPSARIPNLAVAGGVQLELEPVILAVQSENNAGVDQPIGGPSGPLFNLDGGVTSPDGGTVMTGDGGTIGAECANDTECASGRLCINNRCVGCSVNVQCRPGYSCQAGDCVRDCLDNAECPNGLACIDSSCVACITSSDCRDAALVCNAQQRCAHCTSRNECPVGKACLPSGCGTCTLDADCGAGAICEQGVCTAGDCHGNADCNPTEACVGRSCSACTTDAQCRAGQLCLNGGCANGNCRSVLECGAGQVCLGNQCGPCANDTDCGMGQLCLPGTSGLRCTAATCRVNGDCTGASAGLQCVNNSCQTCGTNTPCGNGQICNAQGRCVVGDCFTKLDCVGPKAGFACIAGNCTPCQNAADCGASGFVCVSGLCTSGNCVTPADCATPGQLCVNNACIGCSGTQPCPAGNVCDSDSLCHPGNCLVNANCAPSQVCLNRSCSACSMDAQCGAGRLCIGGACVTGNCRAPSDCAVPGQICANNTCSPCTQTTQCSSGQVCDIDNLCHTGNCVTGSVCPGNQLCVANVCTPCSSDSQCLGSQICFNGGCITGNCHSDADCSGGTRICDLNSHSCRACNNPNTINSADCGGAGRVCDASGFCRTGNCITSPTCGGGQVCANFNCGPCTADAQCSTGQLCVTNACKNGNCHGTGADPNIDCAATNGVCVVTMASNTCTGNCRSNADCAASGYCNTTTHFCGACTGPGQCGVGKVCGTGGVCVTGQCSALEPNCAGTESCVGNQCIQIGPSVQADGGGFQNPGTITGGIRAPMVLSGANTLYFSSYEPASPTGAGYYSTALEPNLTPRWRVRDSTGNASKDSFAGAGIVLPAPGFPNNELFLTLDGTGGLGAIAHRSDTGATVWTVGNAGFTFATGLANGIPQVAWLPLNSSVLNWMRTDGTNLRTATLTPGCSWLATNFGTNGIYVTCAEGVYLVDPVTATVKLVPHNGNPGLNLPNGFSIGMGAIWRPPDNYVTRGVDAGVVNSDILVYSARNNTTVFFLAIRVPDDWVTNPTSTTTWTLWSNTTINANYVPTTIDATGAIYLHQGGSQLYKINVYDGSVISSSAPNSLNTLWNMGSSAQLITANPSGTLTGYLVADGQTAAPTPVWTLPATPGSYLHLAPTFQATSTNFGNLLVTQANATGQQIIRSLAPAPTAPSFVPQWPAWQFGGDSANHNTAPAYECTTDAQCASNETCMLGRCGGQCRTGNDCPAGQGCSLTACQACTKASQCRGGEVCWAGTCMACGGAGCCSTSADCAPGNFCQVGQCRSAPTSTGPGAFSLPGLITRNGQNSAISVNLADGTLYVGDTNGSGQPNWKIVSSAGVLLSTTPTIPLGMASGAKAFAMIANANANPTLYWGGQSSNIYSAPAASSVAAWTTTGYPGLGTIFRLSQTLSAASGTTKPALIVIGSSGAIMAIDTVGAASGVANSGILWTGALGSGCNVASITGLDPLLIGSDGTIYVVCNDNSVEAWGPDGDSASGPPPGRTGLLKWRSAPPAGWSSAATGRPALGKTMTGDVLYYPRGQSASGVAVLNTATATNGTVPLEVAIDGSLQILTDAQGRAIVMGSLNFGSFRTIGVVSPSGVVLAENRTTWQPAGHSAALTGEGQLVFPDLASGKVVGVLVNNPPQLIEVFSLFGAGNTSVDTNSGVVALPGMLIFDHLPVVGSARSLTGAAFSGSTGLIPNAWSLTYGDPQRRLSLKTQ